MLWGEILDPVVLGSDGALFGASSTGGFPDIHAVAKVERRRLAVSAGKTCRRGIAVPNSELACVDERA